MIRDPKIAALGAELEQLGIVVAPHRDHLCVRLPFFASVRVRVDDQGRLDCEPMFGPLNRTHAVTASATILSAVTAGLLYFTGVTPLAVGAAFATIMSGLASSWRFILTESCITRIQLLWTNRLQRQREGERSTALPAASFAALRALEVPSPDLSPPQRVRTERQH
jgi:hypothetical protein